MIWLFAIMIVLVMGAIAMVAAGRGGVMDPVWTDRPDLVLPTDGPIAAVDLRRVRFPLAVRGYRMSDVDALLARLATEMEAEMEAVHERLDEGSVDETVGVSQDALDSGSEGAADAPEMV